MGVRMRRRGKGLDCVEVLESLPEVCRDGGSGVSLGYMCRV